MKVSRNWLNNYLNNALPDAQPVADALTFHAFEIESVETRGSDDILDVKVTPNRGHDCLAHRGIAKELSAILKLPLNAQYDPFARPIDLSKKTTEVSVVVDDANLCKRYIAGYIKGVKVVPSPEWLKASLEAIGQRSINNVVDATNLVMFNIGQPMHAFDAGKLKKENGIYSIAVRQEKGIGTIIGLDGKKYTPTNALLIVDANQNDAIGIAGIKGGLAAQITETTTDIILESANFDGVSVRKTAQALKLRTDASSRFEQVLSPELAAVGMQQAVDLIKTLAGGEVAGFVDVYPIKQEKTYISVTTEKVNAILGTTLTAAEIADVFSRLGLPYKEQDGVFEVQPPFERLDLAIPEDLVEEVGRIVGYDKIPATPLSPATAAPQINKNFYAAEKARAELTAKGYSEVFTSVFADKGEREVLNKIGGEKPYLRSTLIDGLTEALKKNIPNKDLLGLKEVKLFEIGTVWKDGKEQVMLGIAGEKEPATEMLLVGDQNPTSYENLPLSQAEKFKPFSKYPYIVRDIALWVPSDTTPEQVIDIIKREAGELCGSVRLFDTFKKENRTSHAFRLVFQSFERTLTEAEVNAIMEKITAALCENGWEVR